MGSNNARAIGHCQGRQAQAAVEPIIHAFAQYLAEHTLARHADQERCVERRKVREVSQ